MKILLTHGYFLQDDPAEKAVMKPYPPLGLLCLSAWLTKEGIENEVFDPTFGGYEKLTTFLESSQPRILGIYATLMTRLNIIRLIRFIRNDKVLQSSVIILGGPDARHHAKEWLESGVDIVIPGEGEVTLAEVLKLLPVTDKESLADIRGIVFMNGREEVITTPARELMDPDLIPMPAYSATDMRAYEQAWRKNHDYYSFSVNSMRGCPYSCNWCSKSVFGDTYRRKDAAMVVLELLELKKKYNPDRFWFTDDVFTISREWLKKFTAELAKSGNRIHYECISRTDCIDDEIILLLKRSGCNKIWIGAESGSQRVLDLMNRKTDILETINLMKRFREAGIATGTFIMAGYPGEKKKDILLTADYLVKAKPDEFTIALAYPIRGTRFYRETESSFNEPYIWSRYPEKQIRFRRSYSSRFYYFAVRYLFNTAAASRSPRFFTKSVFLLKAFVSRIFLLVMK